MECLRWLGAPAIRASSHRCSRSEDKILLRLVPPACATSWAVTCSARSILARNISKYFSEPGRPSQIFSIKELVPEMIWIRLFSSLATLELWFFSCDLVRWDSLIYIRRTVIRVRLFYVV